MTDRQPHDSRAWRAWLQLALVPGIGSTLRGRLLKRLGSAEAVVAASPVELQRAAGVGPSLSRAIVQARCPETLDSLLATCRQQAIEILTPLDPEFPRLLREIPDPPAVLFVRGALAAQDELAVAMVGTRCPTPYGRKQAERLSAGLVGAGLTVISGLARGIDIHAHRAALEAGGRTIAVVAGGLERIYPPEHHRWAEQISQQGAVMSENPPNYRPLRGAFPRRNRLITGLSLGLVVVEAPARSGALISARHAGEQGRDVFAVPGRVDSGASRGCHRLIRDGAKLVETPADVLEELGPLIRPAVDPQGRTVHRPVELQLSDQERCVLEAIAVEATAIDLVVYRSQLPTHRVLATLSVLEMRGLIGRLGGNAVVRF